jgi:hypothetical protein
MRRLRRFVLLALVGTAGLAAGVALAGPAHGGLLPTVTLPTLPPLPTLPTLTTPTVPTPPPAPTVPVPPAVTAPPAPSPTLPQVAPPPPSAGVQPAGATPPQGGSPAAAKPQRSATRVRATRTHFSSRHGTTIRFRLASPGRVELVVRGPSPSCEVVGRKVVHGRAGANRVRFSGRLHGRPLAPGRYRIDVVVVRRGSSRRIGGVGVEVVRPGQRLTARERTAPVTVSCGAQGAGGAGPQLPAAVVRSRPRLSGTPRRFGVAGATARRSSGGPHLPRLHLPSGEPSGTLGLVIWWTILALIGTVVVGIGVYVAGVVAGAWHP